MQISVIQVTSGFFSWVVCYWVHGWAPWDLLFIGDKWERLSLTDLEDSYGQEWVSVFVLMPNKHTGTILK